MKKPLRRLIVLNNSFEAKQIEQYIQNSVVVCLSLDAESFVKSIKPDYINPLHEIILKKFKRGDRSFYLRNFKLTRTWYKDPIFQYVQDSFGYFLTEFERSYVLSKYILNKFKPTKILIARQKNYRGFEIIHGSLDSMAISLLAKQNNIDLSYLFAEKRRLKFRSLVGKLFSRFRANNGRKLENAEILIIAPGRHLLQMNNMVSELKKHFSVLTITYGLDFSLRSKLSNFPTNLIEKETVLDSKLKYKSQKEWERIMSLKEWKNFKHDEFKNKKIFMDFLKGVIKKIAFEELKPIVKDILLAKQVLESTSPKAVITTTDPDIEVLAYIKTANQMHIKTIALQHGADFTGENPTYNAESKYYVAWSKLAKKWSQKNIPNSKIFAGNSQFHSLEKVSKKSLAQSGPNLRILFLATMNYYEREVPFFLLKLLHALEKSSLKITLVIRTHPSQPLDNLRGLFISKKIDITWDDSRNLNEAISKANIIIFENTTSGLDAMLAKKPVAYFNPYDGDDYFSMGSRGIVTILNSEEIELKIDQLLKEKGQWKSISENGYKFAVEYLGLSGDKDKKLARLISSLI